MTTATFTCPACGTLTRLAADVANRYCPTCHWPTGDPLLGPARPDLWLAHGRVPPQHPDKLLGHQPPGMWVDEVTAAVDGTTAEGVTSTTDTVPPMTHTPINVTHIGTGGGTGQPLWAFCVPIVGDRRSGLLLVQLPTDQHHRELLSRCRDGGLARLSGNEWTSQRFPPTRITATVIGDQLTELVIPRPGGRSRFVSQPPQPLTQLWRATVAQDGGWFGFALVPPDAFDGLPVELDPEQLLQLEPLAQERRLYGGQVRIAA